MRSILDELIQSTRAKLVEYDAEAQELAREREAVRRRIHTLEERIKGISSYA